MNWTQHLRDAARRSGHTLEADVIDELAAHAQSALDAACARGMSLDEAHAHVRRLIDVWILEASALKHAPAATLAVEPPAMTAGMFRGLGSDLRYSFRLLARQRAFAL